jgi:hypothetical protein
MNREDIIRMAREAGMTVCRDEWVFGEMLERFAALAADAEAKRIHDDGMVTAGHMREQIAAEREACAKHAEDFLTKGRSPLGRAVGEAIRARGQA